MKNILKITPVAYVHSDFESKFAVPRQPGLVKSLRAEVILEKEYQKDGIFRGLESFSHIWLIWGFSENYGQSWHPTIRPPRLGGNKRIGVFASRSPFRPNPIGLSAVKLEEVRKDRLIVSGADLVDGTPVYDIKPYVPYTDSVNDATEGFARKQSLPHLKVIIPESEKEKMPEEKVTSLIGILSQDPRPAYQHEPNRVYGFCFAGYEIRFRISDQTVTVISIKPE